MKLRVVHKRFQEPFAIRIVHSRSAYVSTRKEPLRQGEIKADEDEFRLMKRWLASVAIDEPDKKAVEVKDSAGTVVDYRDVMIKGYLSTFENVTKADRQGDVVQAGAFKDTLARFKENPVMLTDHRNSVASLAGKFTVVREDRSGLYVEGLLSNAPGNTDTRFKVAEKMLKTLSMGGIFHYLEDGRTIFRVDLWEGSLTPIPANPDAQFGVRSLTDSEKLYVKTAGDWPSYYHFLEAMRDRKVAA